MLKKQLAEQQKLIEALLKERGFEKIVKESSFEF